MSASTYTVYDFALIREVLDDALRPGGLVSTQRALQFMPLNNGAVVLDAGCGPGKTVSYLCKQGKFQVIGLDRNQQFLPVDHSSANSAPAFACADICKIPLYSQSLDAVLCECVLSLLQEPEKALAEFYRVLKQGGYLYYSDMFARRETNAFLNKSCASCLTKAESRAVLRQRLVEQGFKILFEEDQTWLLRQTAGRLIFEYGSLELFWQAVLGTVPGTECAGQIQALKPGYISFIVLKE